MGLREGRLDDRLPGPGPNVLALRSAVINIDVAAPGTPSAGRVKSYTFDAGSATLAIEVRDSQTHQLLGRAVDARTTPGGSGITRMDDQRIQQSRLPVLFSEWARIIVNGLDDLRGRCATQATRWKVRLAPESRFAPKAKPRRFTRAPRWRRPEQRRLLTGVLAALLCVLCGCSLASSLRQEGLRKARGTARRSCS